jgi:hypothetical protein
MRYAHDIEMELCAALREVSPRYSGSVLLFAWNRNSFLPGIGIPFCLESEFLLRGHSFSHISNLQHRDDLGLNTRFDATMSSVLNQALAAYENERVIGVSTGNEVGGRAGKR